MKRILITLTALTLACGAALAQSASSPASARPDPKVHDEFGDVGFKRLDKDNDGHLTREEVKGHEKIEKYFDDADTNKDGKVSSIEARSARMTYKGDGFARADKDGDGYISKEEVGNRPRGLRQFEERDTNKDGKLSREEAKTFPGSKQ